MLAYPFTMVLHPKFQQKIDIPVYTGYEPPRRLGHHLNFSIMELLNYAQFNPCILWDNTTLFEHCF